MVFFLATFSQGAVNNYLTSYTKDLGLGILFVFTITAVVTFISRFFSKKNTRFFWYEKIKFYFNAYYGC